MKIELNTPQDRLKKSMKRCRVWFWICLVIGVSGLVSAAPAGLIFLAVAAWLWSRKKKALGILQQQDEATVFKYQAKVETKHQENKAQLARTASIETNAATEAAAKQQADDVQQARIAAIKARAIETASQQRAELEARQARIAAAEAEWQQFLDENQLIRIIHTKVAGVTFRNSDGSSRQENLSYCISGGNVEFEHFTYQGAPAYSVSCGGLQIGNLPADLARDLYELDDSYTFVGEIDEVTGGEDGLKYGCNLRIELYRQK